MPSRILQILPSFDAGGVERVTFETVTGLANNRFGQHHVASAGGRYVRQLSPEITHHTLPLQTKNPFTLLVNAKRLYDLIIRKSVLLVHARSRAPAWSALVACKFAKIPFVTTYHGTYNGSSRVKLYYNSIMARGDRVIAISRFILNHIEKKHPTLTSKLMFIPEGIDTTYFDPALMTVDRINAARHEFDVPTDATVLLLPGRLTRWKGQAWFLDALRDRADWMKSRNVYVVIVGDAQGRVDYYEELVTLADDLIAKGVPVRFKTDCVDLPAAYALADIVFSCSIEPEAFGRIAAEALSMGRPFIGTNHGGTVELTGEGRFGSMVAPGDNAALLTEIERTLSCELEALRTRGALARGHIQANYSLDQMLRLTQELYESVLSPVIPSSPPVIPAKAGI
jgi:glycosyltransferase involved in cell wall biosynthesis